MAGQISARNGGGSGALSRAGERTRTTGVDCKDIICRRYLYKETVRGGERSVALGGEIRPDRPAQVGRQRFAPDLYGAFPVKGLWPVETAFLKSGVMEIPHFGVGNAATSGAANGEGWPASEARASSYSATSSSLRFCMRAHRWRELDSNFPYAGAVNLAFAPFVYPPDTSKRIRP